MGFVCDGCGADDEYLHSSNGRMLCFDCYRTVKGNDGDYDEDYEDDDLYGDSDHEL